MQNSNSISVIIPTFNRAKIIHEAIDSVLLQTYKPIEIIVIDDGSSDETKEALELYIREQKIRYIYQNNAGVSSARNVGIEISKGKWLAFLDSDDRWHPDKLQTHINGLIKHPNIVAHTVNATYEGKGTNSYKESELPMIEDDGFLDRPLVWQLIHSALAMPPTIFCLKDAAINAGRFDESMSICEDYDFMCRLALQGAWGYDWKELAVIIRRDEQIDNLSKGRFKDQIKTYSSMVQGLSKLLNYSGINSKELDIVKERMAHAQFILGLSYTIEGKDKLARSSFMSALFARYSVKSMVAMMLTYLPAEFARFIVQKRRNLK
ncbi:MAG: glycosyltransferase family 2 protein [Desulfobulbus sp.]|nr:glycosyltransferase family 2 protein [Desulfobulbus sp.]